MPLTQYQIQASISIFHRIYDIWWSVYVCMDVCLCFFLLSCIRSCHFTLKPTVECVKIRKKNKEYWQLCHFHRLYEIFVSIWLWTLILDSFGTLFAPFTKIFFEIFSMNILFWSDYWNVSLWLSIIVISTIIFLFG